MEHHSAAQQASPPCWAGIHACMTPALHMRARPGAFQGTVLAPGRVVVLLHPLSCRQGLGDTRAHEGP